MLSLALWLGCFFVQEVLAACIFEEYTYRTVCREITRAGSDTQSKPLNRRTQTTAVQEAFLVLARQDLFFEKIVSPLRILKKFLTTPSQQYSLLKNH